MSIVEELRNKTSRDNRGLLDRAALEIEDLERNLVAAYAKIEALQKELKDDELACKQSEGEWVNKSGDRVEFYEYTYQCSLCGYYMIICDEEDVNFCPNCGAKMKGGAE